MIFLKKSWFLSTLFLSQGSKSSLFSLYRERFSRYGLIFRIAIFGHETWPLAKMPDVAHIPSFHPKGSNLSLFSLYGQRFSRYGPISKLPYLAMKLGHWPKFQKLYIYFLNYPWVPNFTPFCSTAGHFQDIGNFAFSHWSQC